MLLLTFNALTNRYAIDSRHVVELIPRVDLCSIPHAPPFLVGMFVYHGTVVPVIDLGLLLAQVACCQSLSTRIILVNHASADRNREHVNPLDSARNGGAGTLNQTHNVRLMGLVAERVYDLTQVKPEQIVPAPVRIPEAPYLDTIVQIDQGIVQLITVKRLCDALHSALLTPLAPALPPQSSGESSLKSDGSDAESGES